MAKQRFLNNFTTTFVAAVKDAPSTGSPATELDYGILRLSDGAAGALLNPTGGDYYVLTAFKRSGSTESNIEVMRVTAVSNATPGECRVTVQRAQEGTTAKAFVSGDYLSLRMTRGTAENFAQPDDMATKVDKVAGKGLSTEDYTTAEKTKLAGIAPGAQVNTVTSVAGKTGAVTLAKGDVGLGNVDNTADVDKPVSTAQASALAGKEASISAGSASQYWRGDKTWRDFVADVRAATLAGLSTATNAAVVATDSILAAIGKLQAQVNAVAPQPSLRNKIINGKMEIAQRGTSFVSPPSGTYTLDRFAYVATGVTSTATVSQQADVPSSNEFQSSLRVAITTADASIAAGDLTTIRQLIEGYNARDLIGRTFTLSFWVRSSKTGIHCVGLRNSGVDRSWVAEYTVNAANTWEQKSITFPGGLITAGTWDWTTGIGLRVDWVLAAGSTFQSTAGSWLSASALATSSQVNVLDTVGNIFAITGVQLEVGSTATPFEHRPYDIEFARCQRYTPAVSGPTIVGSGWCSSSVQCYIEVPHQVTPRVPPTGITVTAASGFNVYSNAAASLPCTAIAFNGGGTHMSRLSVQVSSGLNQGDGTGLYATSSNEKIIFTGCEL